MNTLYINPESVICIVFVWKDSHSFSIPWKVKEIGIESFLKTLYDLYSFCTIYACVKWYVILKQPSSIKTVTLLFALTILVIITTNPTTSIITFPLPYLYLSLCRSLLPYIWFSLIPPSGHFPFAKIIFLTFLSIATFNIVYNCIINIKFPLQHLIDVSLHMFSLSFRFTLQQILLFSHLLIFSPLFLQSYESVTDGLCNVTTSKIIIILSFSLTVSNATCMFLP